MKLHKELSDYSFEELVEQATLKIHTALLNGGGKEMKSEVFAQFAIVIEWADQRDKKSNKKK